MHLARLLACAVISLLCWSPALPAGEDAALSGKLSRDGLITWWLAAVPTPAEGGIKPPLNAKAGNAFGEAKWNVEIAESFYNDFRKLAGVGRHPVYAAVRVRSAQGGARVLYVRTFCATRAWLGAKLILDKPKPEKVAMLQAPLALVPGENELLVELTPRTEGCLMQTFLIDARTQTAEPKPALDDTLELPLADSKLMTNEEAAFRSLAVNAKSAFVTPGGSTPIAVETQGSVAAATQPLSVELDQAAAKPVLFSGAPVQLEFKTPPKLRGLYEARVNVKAAGKVVGTRTLSLLCLDGFEKEIGTLEADFKQRAAKAGKPCPNTALALEKLRLTLHAIQAGVELPGVRAGEELTTLLENVRTYLPVEESGGDPLAKKTGYMERAYVSAIDGGVQPFIVGVPDDDAHAKKPAPLVVFLHGYDPSIDKNRWWEARDFAQVCARNGCYLAIPFGRSNTDFQTCGEVDVLDVIAEMKRLYAIDPERVYLYGYSMGGMAVYTMAAHHPDDFAAGIVMAGRADNPLQNYSAVENFHPFKQLLIRNEQPLALCENLLNFPLRIYHGQDDPVVPKTEALRMAARFKEIGADVQLFLKPGGHTFGFELLVEDEPLQWLLSKKRRNARTGTTQRVMNVYSLQHARQSLVAVDEYAGGLDAIRVKWTEKEGAVTIAEKSPNIIKLTTDGTETLPLDSAVKTAGLCGPVRQAICAPFTLVYGTTGTATANVRNKLNAERYAEEWFAFTRSRAVLKADTEVTADDQKNRNLFLFGEEQENAVHRAAAGKLPIAVKNGNVTIGERTEALGENRGILYVAPNPLPNCTGRALVILAGKPYGDKIGANHKLDLVPDFLLYDDTFDKDGTSTNHALCAGFFDGHWKLDAKTTWWLEALK